jgi:hypothetical protein
MRWGSLRLIACRGPVPFSGPAPTFECPELDPHSLSGSFRRFISAREGRWGEESLGKKWSQEEHNNPLFFPGSARAASR